MLDDALIIAFMILNFILFVWNTYSLSKLELDMIVLKAKVSLDELVLEELKEKMES